MRICAIALALMGVFTAITLVCCSNQKDRLDAQKAADRIHSFIKNRDFASIYRESGDGFKQEGDESRFVDSMSAIYENVGALKAANPVTYQNTMDSEVGRQHVLVFDLEFERSLGRERLVFTRAKSGEMRLWDIRIEPAN